MIVTVTIVATLIMMIPIYWMVNAAIRPIREVLTVPPKFIPETVTFDYIKAVWKARATNNILGIALLSQFPH